jgi:hypothetical protein
MWTPGMRKYSSLDKLSACRKISYAEMSSMFHQESIRLDTNSGIKRTKVRDIPASHNSTD